MTDEKDFLEVLGDDLEAADPTYAIDRKKESAVSELINLRASLGLSQREVAERMGLPSQRVTEIESRPWRATWERIHAYAKALGADFTLTLPSNVQEKLVAAIAQPDIDIRALGKKLKDLAESSRHLRTLEADKMWRQGKVSILHLLANADARRRRRSISSPAWLDGNLTGTEFPN